MGILNPAALPFVSLLGVLVLIYLRQRTRTRIEVPSLLFWTDVPEDRVRSRRFRPDLLFLLQILLLLLLIGGLLHPYWSRTVTETRGDRQILVFDLSASMQARENGVRRFDLALDQAKDVLHDLAPLDEVMLIGPRSSAVLQQTIAWCCTVSKASGRRIQAPSWNWASNSPSSSVTGPDGKPGFMFLPTCRPTS